MIAFKEWEVVCQALEKGQQSLILRKGGIHEGKEGFSFKHREFALFPTRFHAQGDLVKIPWEVTKGEWEVGDEISICSMVTVTSAETLYNWEQVQKLANQHIWKEQVVYDRFFWEGKGMQSGSIHVAHVKVSKLAKPIQVQYSKKFAGCRSWVELDL